MANVPPVGSSKSKPRAEQADTSTRRDVPVSPPRPRRQPPVGLSAAGIQPAENGQLASLLLFVLVQFVILIIQVFFLVAQDIVFVFFVEVIVV